jgi:hypothetical protein
VEAPCTGGCSNISTCANGQIMSFCCPPDATCDTEPYCDLGGGACGPYPCQIPDGGPSCTTSIYAAQYDQSCASDADCTAVYSGPLCGECYCPNSAINRSAITAYASDTARGEPGGMCGCPLIPPAMCLGGACILSSVIAAADAGG